METVHLLEWSGFIAHHPTLVKLDLIHLGCWFSTGGGRGVDFASRGHLTTSGDIFGCHNCLGQGEFLATSGYRPGIAVQHPEMCRTTPQKRIISSGCQ